MNSRGIIFWDDDKSSSKIILSGEMILFQYTESKSLLIGLKGAFKVNFNCFFCFSFSLFFGSLHPTTFCLSKVRASLWLFLREKLF